MGSESVEDVPEMPTPIPPPVDDDESLKTYFAVQLKPREAPIHVVAAFMNTAKGLGVFLRRLEVLDTLTVGGTSFVRMRTEILTPSSVLDKLYGDGRSIISSGQDGQYAARLPGGRIGKVAHLTMHAVPKLGQTKMYRGTKMKHWERQFEAA